MKPSILIAVMAVALATATLARADPTDPAAARELLKRGFALRKAGNYLEALGRLNESLRFDYQAKTLINIADCEEQLGQLTRAQEHWIAARDQATADNNGPLITEASRRLAALEARMPKLTVRPPDEAVPGIEIRRDGVLLMAGSFGVPLPTDPGTHEIVVSATGYENRSYTVDLKDDEQKVLSVEPGAALRPPATVAEKPVEAPRVTGSSSSAAKSGGWPIQRTLAVGAFAAGAVSLGAAAITWSQAVKQNRQARDTCTPGCSAAGHSLRAEAEANANRSTALLVAGAALAVGGGVLILTTPKRESAAVSLTPLFDSGYAGMVLVGSF